MEEQNRKKWDNSTTYVQLKRFNQINIYLITSITKEMRHHILRLGVKATIMIMMRIGRDKEKQLIHI